MHIFSLRALCQCILQYSMILKAGKECPDQNVEMSRLIWDFIVNIFSCNTSYNFLLLKILQLASPSINMMGKKFSRWHLKIFKKKNKKKIGFTCHANCLLKKVFNFQSGQEYMEEMTMFNVQRAITPKSRQTRVTLHVLSLIALHLWEVLQRYLGWYQSYGADTNDWSADRRMDWY